MGPDHLDKEISISAELTPSGVKTAAKSRTIAAIDRLIGCGIDRLCAPVEAKTAEIRAKSEARIKIIESLGELGIERLKADPELVAIAVQNQFDSIVRRQENKEAVIAASLEDLRREPPTSEQTTEGRDTLESAFLNRFERYAEEATEEHIREKWGRVLAAEIRQPGTFSQKVLRVVDELDGATALLFERICEYRSCNVIPRCLVGKLSFSEVTSLTDAGLLVNPGIAGQNQYFSETEDVSGQKLWTAHIGKALIAIPHATAIPNNGDKQSAPITIGEDVPGIPVYVLTDTGHAISRILEDKEENVLSSYIGKLTSTLPLIEVREYRAVNGKGFNLVKTHRGPIDTPVTDCSVGE